MTEIRPSKRGVFRTAAVLVLPLAATVTSGHAEARPTAGSFEVNVTTSPDITNGQPVVAVNPIKPSNLVYVSTAHLTKGPDLVTLACVLAYSEDGGKTWKQSAFPYGDRPQCGDPYLAVDKGGNFHIAWNALGCPSNPAAGIAARCPEGTSHVRTARSNDGGRTWSSPVDTSVLRATTPRLRIDRATGYIYVVGAMGPPSPHAVTVSKDGGKTWSPYAALPAQPFGNQIAVHGGLLATATSLTIADKSVVAGEVRFAISADDGRTFTSYPVTDRTGQPAKPPSGRSMPENRTISASDPVPWLSADPTHTGRFAVMLPNGKDLSIYVTADAGKTWTGPVRIAAPGAAKPWMDYGPRGELGVVWRTLDGDMSNVYATVSFNGGRSFGKPVRINRKSYPYGYTGTGGDEWSRILVEGSNVYVTWADTRMGTNLDGIVARVPIARFKR